MKKTTILTLMSMALIVFHAGCSSSDLTRTGFLSDYSKLQKESDSVLRYVDQTSAPKYSAFIVEPVLVQFSPEAKSEGNLTGSQIKDLSKYMQKGVLDAVRNAGMKVTTQPGSGVARIRIALTDIEKTGALNMLPQASLMGAGVGGASMEAEVVDSVTGRQVGAIVQSKQGSRMPFSNLGDWTAAKSVMDAWAQRFQQTLKAMHGK